MKKNNVYEVKEPSVLSFLLFFLKRYKLNFAIIAFMAMIVQVSSNTVWPWLLGELVNAFESSKSIDAIMPLMILVILYWVIATGAQSIKGFMFGITRPKFCADIRSSLFNIIMHHRHTYFVNKYIGNISQRISELPRSAQMILDNALTVFGPLIVSIISSVAAFFYVHEIISMMFSVFLLVYIGITIILGNRASRYCDESYKSFAELFGCIVDSIRNHFSVRIFSGLQNEKRFIQVAQNVEIKKSRKAFFFLEKLGYQIIIGN